MWRTHFSIMPQTLPNMGNAAEVVGQTPLVCAGRLVPPYLHHMVGRSPWTAADAPVGLLAPRKMPIPLLRCARGSMARSLGLYVGFGFSSRSCRLGEKPRLRVRRPSWSTTLKVGP